MQNGADINYGQLQSRLACHHKHQQSCTSTSFLMLLYLMMCNTVLFEYHHPNMIAALRFAGAPLNDVF